jgi:hypothetical protein
MNALWLFVGAVVLLLALLAWLEYRDMRVLRDHLRRRYPVRLTNSFWGALQPNDGTAQEPDAGATDRHADPDTR